MIVSSVEVLYLESRTLSFITCLLHAICMIFSFVSGGALLHMG